MTQDNRNLALAIGLSVLVVIGWQYFYGLPQMEKARQTQEQLKQTTAPKTADGQPSLPTAGSKTATPSVDGSAPRTDAVVVAAKTREEAISSGPRVKIDTPSLSGSIALTGARIDDVSLKSYRETVDPGSPQIVLLSPSGAPEPYYAELGFVGQPGATVALPGSTTVWSADNTMLTPDRPVTLSWDNGQGLTFRRVISVDGQYMFTVKDTVDNKGAAAVTLFPYALLSRHGKPHVSGYAVLHEGLVGVVGDSRVQEITYDGIEKETRSTRILKGTGGWIGFTDKYWATAIVPDQSVPYDGKFTAFGEPRRIYQTDVLDEAKTIAPGASADVTTRVFAGAKETATLDAYQKNLGIKNFDLLIDWGWFYFITKPLFFLIDFIYHFVGNFGVAILIVTVLVKAAFFPLANRSYASMAKMKALQPKMTEVKERFPDDKAKQQQELMELYKKEKINPVAGCLPMVIQIPVFFALYKVIFVTIEMRHAPFFGWIHDLSSPDPTNVFTLFGLIPWNPHVVPLVGSFLVLGIWPMIMGISMFVQMKMNPEPQDPVQKQMFTWMPVIFTFMLGSFPSGLVIYWTWNNTLSVIQQGLIMKKSGVKIELWDNLAGLFGRKNA